MASVFPSEAVAVSSARPIGRYSRTAWPSRFTRNCYIALAAFAAVYGFAFALYGEFSLVGFMTPFPILLGIVLWVMPELRRVPVRLMCALLPPFTYVLLCWPDYLAVAITNLPWITALRLVGLPMVLTLLVCTFGSPAFRARMGDIFDGERLILRFSILFMIYALLSVFLSDDIGFSFGKLVIVAWSWFGVFMVSCYFFAKPGSVRRFANIMVITTVYSIVIGLYEVQYRHLPWAGHIPSFLNIDDPRIRTLLAGSSRAATGAYRVQSRFSTSIGLGEFFGMSIPFLMHLLFSLRQHWAKLLILVIIGLALFVAIQTDSRLAFISFVSSVLLYILFHAYVTWRNQRANLFAPAVMLIYPVFLALFVVLAITWRRLNVMVFGTGAQEYSTIARQMQWSSGWPKIFHNPFGHGVGTSPMVLNFHTPGSGQQTIDSYYLGALLEFGVLGFIFYYAMFVIAMFQAGRAAIETKDKETLFLGAAAIALLNYLVSKSIYSQLENNPLAFMLLGMVVALLRRYKAETGQLPPLPEDDGLDRPQRGTMKPYAGLPKPA